MICTNFYETLEIIHTIESRELLAALQAHGGKFEWGDEDCNRPIVSVESESGLANCSILKAEIDEAEFIKLTVVIEGSFSLAGWEDVVYSSDVLPGHLQYITSSIPATEKVHSVIGSNSHIF